MSQVTPSFAYCMLKCGPSGKNCIDEANLDWVFGELWHEVLRGSQDMTNAMLAEWDMATRPSLTKGERQIFLYVPPCLHALEIAVSFSLCAAKCVAAIFRSEQERGLPVPQLPCKIRIDDRLESDVCDSGIGYAGTKLKILRDYLRACSMDQRQIALVEKHTFLPGSGSWLTKHFDLPYLDRRCFETEQGDSTRVFTVDTMDAANSLKHYQTANLVITGSNEITKLAPSSVESTVPTRFSPTPSTICRLHPGRSSEPLSFYGHFQLLRPEMSQTERDEKNRRGYYNNSDHNDSDQKPDWGRVIDVDKKEIVKAGKYLFKKFIK